MCIRDSAQIEEIVRFAIKHVPSAFNSQSTRAVLLLHEHHEELWKIVKRTLRAIVPEDEMCIRDSCQTV